VIGRPPSGFLSFRDFEKEIGRQLIGVMRGGDISWQLGRAIGLGFGL